MSKVFFSEFRVHLNFKILILTVLRNVRSSLCLCRLLGNIKKVYFLF